MTGASSWGEKRSSLLVSDEADGSNWQRISLNLVAGFSDIAIAAIMSVNSLDRCAVML